MSFTYLCYPLNNYFKTACRGLKIWQSKARSSSLSEYFASKFLLADSAICFPRLRLPGCDDSSRMTKKPKPDFSVNAGVITWRDHLP